MAASAAFGKLHDRQPRFLLVLQPVPFAFIDVSMPHCFCGSWCFFRFVFSARDIIFTQRMGHPTYPRVIGRDFKYK